MSRCTWTGRPLIGPKHVGWIAQTDYTLTVHLSSVGTFQITKTTGGHVMKHYGIRIGVIAVAALFMTTANVSRLSAQPSLLHPDLQVRTYVGGLFSPTSMVFLGPNDVFVLEKNTGQVKRVVGGAVQSVVLDLAVNFASERGLLGIALHPQFPANPGVYLYWTESTTGNDTNVLSQTPLLGNRVDRFTWNGTFLAFDRNLLRIRALQQDAGQPERGNHNGGVLRFGPDGKLYVFVGDVGRRGWLQNLPCGPTDRYDCPPGTPVPDDQFGGPEPDDAHLTGVILRLNDDGSTPTDNPFFAAGAAIGGEVGANIQQIFSYGHRNAFGMAFDPYSGHLWLAENGDDAFTELNRVEGGMNGGWVQIMGPVDRIGDYKSIETSPDTDPVTGAPYFGLQQIRWSPENIADSPSEALSRLFMLPGAHYRDPVLSWKYEVAPAGIGFVHGTGLGSDLDGDLFIGAARDFLEDGHLFRVKLLPDRQGIDSDDPQLADGVIENNHKWDLTGSESLLIGRGFGISTDIQTGPNGNLFVVSLSDEAIYEIFRSAEPVCELVGVNREDGKAVSVTIHVRDVVSGITRIDVNRARNARLEIPAGSGNFFDEGESALFDPPETGLIEILGAKIDVDARSQVVIDAWNAQGLMTRCDPLIVTLAAELPETHILEQNYPNPFNPATKFRYALSEDAHVRLEVFDTAGRSIEVLVDENQAAGWREVTFDGSALPSGVYIYRLRAGSFNKTMFMTLLK